MPPDASKTRAALIDAAARAFAEHGIENASLIEITRQAGQRNRAALYYHFGSRDGVLGAIIDRHAEFLARREGELLEQARATPPDDVAAVVEAIVRPAAELAERDWRGRCCLVIIAELAGENPATLSPEIQAALARTGGHDVYALLDVRLPDLEPDVRVERLSVMTTFVLRTVADRAQAIARRATTGRAQLATEPFVENLVAMAAGALTAPARRSTPAPLT